jgi:hypothetical protein
VQLQDAIISGTRCVGSEKKEKKKRKREIIDEKMRSGFRAPQWPSTGKEAGAEKLLSNNISTKLNFIIAYRIAHIARRILPAYSRISKVPISTLSKHTYTTMSGEITHPTIKGS